ncbi:MAG TPA: response regulator transcription factor [Puia sp.]|jgi:two-component system invasion response regulator UvrY|nr:response regulator transcription factor [Puia sp.]
MLKILLADDHSVIRQRIKQILLEEYPSSQIEEAEDGAVLVKKFMTGHWDLIIADISMPVMSGLEALQHIREHLPAMPVLLLSIYCDQQYALRAIKAGATAYLCKENAQDELIHTVNRLIV